MKLLHSHPHLCAKSDALQLYLLGLLLEKLEMNQAVLLKEFHQLGCHLQARCRPYQKKLQEPENHRRCFVEGTLCSNLFVHQNQDFVYWLRNDWRVLTLTYLTMCLDHRGQYSHQFQDDQRYVFQPQPNRNMLQALLILIRVPSTAAANSTPSVVAPSIWQKGMVKTGVIRMFNCFTTESTWLSNFAVFVVTAGTCC